MIPSAKQKWEPFWLFETRKKIEIYLVGKSVLVPMTMIGFVLLVAFTYTGTASSSLSQEGPIATSFSSVDLTNQQQTENLKPSEMVTSGEAPKPQVTESSQDIESSGETEEEEKGDLSYLDDGKVLTSTTSVATTSDSGSVEQAGNEILDSNNSGRPPHSKRTSDMFDVPQSVCPGMPSKVPLSKGNPAPRVIPEVSTRLDMIADGVMYLPDSQDPAKRMLNTSCLFVTKQCGHSALSVQGRWIMNKLKEIDTPEKLAEFAERLPDIPERGLGSCAIVGNSDNLMRTPRGAEIDAHDTIFRHNTPIKGFEKWVGARSSIVYMKSKYTKNPPKGSIDMSKIEIALAELKDIAEVPRSMRLFGKHIFLRASASNHFARERRKLYQIVNAPRSRHPSGGFGRPINMLASKLCTRIDLYGFSGNMGGKYFARKERVRPAHLMQFEHWTYRYLQAKGKLCVYGD